LLGESMNFKELVNNATVVFDNDPRSRCNDSICQPIRGVTTGRNKSGRLNGTLSAEDILDMIAQLQLQGIGSDKLHFVFPYCVSKLLRPRMYYEFSEELDCGDNKGHFIIYDDRKSIYDAAVAKNVRFLPEIFEDLNENTFGSNPIDVLKE